MARLWVGIDASKHAHHAAALDEAGVVLWHRRVPNDQAAIADLVTGVTGHVTWAVDLLGPETGLLRAVLAAAGYQVVYVPGRTVKAMAGSFPGEAKTDARDAVVIANTARMRRDLTVRPLPSDLVATLSILLGHRTDLVADRVRAVNRLQRLVCGVCPALERALNLTNVAALLLVVAAFPTAQAIRRAGRQTIAAHLRSHHARGQDRRPGTCRRSNADPGAARPGHRRSGHRRAGQPRAGSAPAGQATRRSPPPWPATPRPASC